MKANRKWEEGGNQQGEEEQEVETEVVQVHPVKVFGRMTGEEEKEEEKEEEEEEKKKKRKDAKEGQGKGGQWVGRRQGEEKRRKRMPRGGNVEEADRVKRHLQSPSVLRMQNKGELQEES